MSFDTILRLQPMPGGGTLLMSGKILPGAWEYFTWQANGVTERSARRVMQWEELMEVPDGPHVDALGNPTATEPTPEELAERRLENLKRAARRAKTKCRRVIITEGFDELLTLTYRDNQEDRELCKQHFKVWVRRMKLALGHDVVTVDALGRKYTRRVPGNFRFCASFERQQRGAMHVHIATNALPAHAVYKGVKIKAWKLGTQIWRDIVGANNGLCFVGGSTKFGGRRRNLSLAKMAAYVSKYILKDFEDHPEESNRYSRSQGTQVPKQERVTFYGLTDLEAIELAFERADNQVLHALKYRPFGSIWLCVEDIPPDKKTAA